MSSMQILPKRIPGNPGNFKEPSHKTYRNSREKHCLQYFLKSALYIYSFVLYASLPPPSGLSWGSTSPPPSVARAPISRLAPQPGHHSVPPPNMIHLWCHHLVPPPNLCTHSRYDSPLQSHPLTVCQDALPWQPATGNTYIETQHVLRLSYRPDIGNPLLSQCQSHLIGVCAIWLSDKLSAVRYYFFLLWPVPVTL